MELRCLVTGIPAPSVTWYLEGTKLEDSLYYRLAENRSLIIVFMLPQLEGEYVCLAENVLGNTSFTVYLEYLGKHSSYNEAMAMQYMQAACMCSHIYVIYMCRTCIACMHTYIPWSLR